MPPERLRDEDVRLVASVSGGKDSTATALWLREQGLDFEAVFADTGWEADATYAYLDEVLQPVLGPIRRVQAEIDLPSEMEPHAAAIEAILGRRSPMVRRILRSLTFPRRTMRWCTAELKVTPLRSYHQALIQQGLTVVAAVGVRADESEKRARLPAWELEEGLDAVVWRPILERDETWVWAMLRRHAVRPNPLYLQRANRVGCWPCMFASKDEYALLAGDDRRVEALRELERVVGDLWEHTDRDPDHRRPTWHHGWPPGNGPLPLMPPIDQVLLWARTQRQSLQLRMFHDHELVAASCARMGLCEVIR